MEFGKKKGMSPLEKKAKLSVLKDLHGQSSDLMKDGLKNLKKVTIASDSKSGLKAGLDKAEDMLGEESEEECPACDGEGCAMCGAGNKEKAQSEGYEDAQDESEPMDEDELDAKIQELMAMKEKLQK